MNKPNSITVIGRRWFQKTYGNTYFSSQIIVDGVPVGGREFAYGYGDYYLQDAAEWLKANGYLPAFDGPLSLYCRENGIAFSYSVTDVQRKKDL